VKRGEETIMPNWVLDAIDGLTLASDIKVLSRIARRANYKRSTVSLGELIDATGLDLRTIQTSLARLRQLTYIESTDGVHSLRGACAAVAQPLRKSTHPATPLEPVQHEEKAVPEVREVMEVREEQKTHTSADADKRSEKAKHTPAASFLLSLWNDHRGQLPKAEPTEKRLKKLDQIAAALGADAERVMRSATLEVAADSFWRERKYNLDNLLAGEKYIGKAESWAARPQNIRLNPVPAAPDLKDYDFMTWMEEIGVVK